MHESIELTDCISERAEALNHLGFADYDALHLASAEAGEVDVFLTTDDTLLKRPRRFADKVHVEIVNPATWLKESEHGI